jgi:succinate-semialdehyde dehydrogenase/glutarate-semialdehyde dehydrogenase
MIPKSYHISMKSINPYSGKLIKEYPELSENEVSELINSANLAFFEWRETNLAARSNLMLEIAKSLREQKSKFAELITNEMGKPISQSQDEIEKCAITAEYYAKNISKILQNEIHYNPKYQESYVTFEPIGIILAIMPWNFPFWQAFRAAIPTILAGNVMVLKHASNVQGCAQTIEEIFTNASFPERVFTNLAISSSKVESIIKNNLIKGITLTGSEEVGSIVGLQAGKEIKKTVMELGGSDAFIVLEDADLEKTAETLIKSRLRNAGQTCTSPKRIIVHSSIKKVFIEKLVEGLKKIKIGDPMQLQTDLGPLSSQKAADEVLRQINESASLGANLIYGGNRIESNFILPTVLENVKKGMPAFDEEIFGPVFAIIEFNTIEEAIEIANDHRYGLASSIWTKDINLAKELIPKIEAGSVFVNTAVSSDPTMPFGGIKKSGFGRELSEYGIKEFLNIKTVIINK